MLMQFYVRLQSVQPKTLSYLVLVEDVVTHFHLAVIIDTCPYIGNFTITKELALDRRAWKLAIYVPEP
jgi:hypothetical protein